LRFGWIKCYWGDLPQASTVGTIAKGRQGRGNWHLGLHLLTVLLGDLGHDRGAVNRLDDLACGDWDSLGDLLGGVDAHLLGDLAAVRLDGSIPVGQGSWGSQGGEAMMGHVGGSDGVPSKAQPGLSLSLGFPLDDGNGTGCWAANLGHNILALLLKSDGLLLHIHGVTHILDLGHAVLGLDILVGESALGVSDGGGEGWGSNWGEGWGSQGTIAPGLGRGGGTSHSGQARIGYKLVHGDLSIVLMTSHDEISS